MPGRNDHSTADEFLVEAQELVEVLSRDLLMLEARGKAGESQLEILNDSFRTVHTIKGLAGMFGFANIGRLAHILEDLLDDLRLGRLELSTPVMDRLFEGAEGLSTLLTAIHQQSDALLNLDAFARSAEAIARKQPASRQVLDDYDLDPSILAVLTEYEEHRLRDNLERGIKIYRLHVAVPLELIENTIEDLKSRCSGVAEIIGYLPSMDHASENNIDMTVLIASDLDSLALGERLGSSASSLSVIQKRPVFSKPLDAPTAEQPIARASAPQRALSVAAAESLRLSAGASVERDERSLRSLSSMVRVDIRRLDHLLNAVGELSAVRAGIARLLQRVREGELDSRQVAIEMHHVHRNFGRLLSEVQESVLEIRMVPLSQLFDKMAVVLRQTMRECGKDARLNVTGADTEVDKLIVEAIADPLMHIVRNAVDHGVERPEERISAGKSPQAEVSICAYQKGNHVVIEIADDGRGVDPNLIREVAANKGLLPAASGAELPAAEILQMLFVPGFSTAREVTDLSGRGVGMDVVKTNIARLGGAVDLTSEVGTGTKVTIVLPITLAIINVLLFEVGGRLLSISLASVQEALRVDEDAFFTVGGKEMLSLRGETLPLCRLGVLLGYGERAAGRRYVVVVEVGQRHVGLVVDRLSGQQDVVIKGLGPSLSQVAGVAGATDLGDGRLVLVLDTVAILEEVLPSIGNLQWAGGLHERL